LINKFEKNISARIFALLSLIFVIGKLGIKEEKLTGATSHSLTENFEEMIGISYVHGS
jgi:hypothetical protein